MVDEAGDNALNSNLDVHVDALVKEFAGEGSTQTIYTADYEDKSYAVTVTTAEFFNAHQEAICGWQPIETSPKDGTAILLYFPHRDIVIRGTWDWQGEGDYEGGITDWKDWVTDDDTILQEDPSYAPTLWMPLLTPKPS
jgi:hypothetical protein